MGFSRLQRLYYKEYIARKGMLARCYTTSNSSFKYCGARGVVVCTAWRLSFATFLQDMGTAPSQEYSLDRYPNGAGNYEPGNVRWATPSEQQHNTIKNVWLAFQGRTLCLADWAKETGLPESTIAVRHEAGWPAELILTTPVLNPTLLGGVVRRSRLVS
jgi:hypothetical protein